LVWRSYFKEVRGEEVSLYALLLECPCGPFQGCLVEVDSEEVLVQFVGLDSERT
jgi:hypothetical protein